MKTSYNKTELHVYETLERNIAHRDFYAHLFRWSHVLKIADIGMKILDVGCGSAGLFETFYRNRYKPSRYVGIDIRNNIIESNSVKWSDKGAEFICQDAVTQYLPRHDGWDMICSFELLEHVGKKNVGPLLDNIKNVASDYTKILISTPCFNGVDYADNHVVDGEVAELTFKELESLLLERFTIKNVWGTFASIKDYKPLLSGCMKDVFDKLSEYYDTNMLSVIMAPLFPRNSRNCLWEVKI